MQAVAATLRRHPSIAIIPLLLFLAMTTGGVIGVIFVAQNETHQRRMSAEGTPPAIIPACTYPFWQVPTLPSSAAVMSCAHQLPVVGLREIR